MIIDLRQIRNIIVSLANHIELLFAREYLFFVVRGGFLLPSVRVLSLTTVALAVRSQIRRTHGAHQNFVLVERDTIHAL